MVLNAESVCRQEQMKIEKEAPDKALLTLNWKQTPAECKTEVSGFGTYTEHVRKSTFRNLQ